MAMEANAAGLSNVAPIQKSQPVSNTEKIERRSGDTSGSSPFSPETNVTIKNSIEDMAGILSKVAAMQNTTADEIPQQLQKILQSIMKSAFSVDASVAEGMGSTVESQRFTVEQLTTLSRMLTQMGIMSEKGALTSVSDSMQTLLGNLKILDGANGEVLNAVALNKLAFQLLGTKEVSDLPEQLQVFLGQQLTTSGTLAGSSQQTAGNGFLKQLIQYFMPTTQGGRETTVASEQNNTANANNINSNSNSNSNTITQNKNVNTTNNNTNNTNNTEQKNTTATRANVVVQNRTANTDTNTVQNSNTENVTMVKGERASGTVNSNSIGIPLKGDMGGTEKNVAANAENAAPQAKDQSQKMGNMLQKENTENVIGTKQDSTVMRTAQEPEADQGNMSPLLMKEKVSENPAMKQTTMTDTKNTLSDNTVLQSQNMTQQSAAVMKNFAAIKNIPQAMDTMKSLASLLLRDANLSEQDRTLLQGFVNGTEKTLSEQDAKQLQLLIRLSQKNMPAVIQQAAYKQDLPELPKLWAFVQLCDLSELKSMQSHELKNAGKNISDFATMLKNTMTGDSNVTENQRSISFMMPLYLGDNEKSYPTYIHVYDEKKQSNEASGEYQKETWLRLCLLTENIGAVELVCQLYENQNLNVQLLFSDGTVAKNFNEYIPEFKDSFVDSSLVLKDLKVGTVGSKS
jgi:hypothetical protein